MHKAEAWLAFAWCLIGIAAAGCSRESEDQLPAFYSISGTVSGDLAEGVQITITGTRAGSTTTAEGGVYSFGNLPNGSYIITPSISGYTLSPASIAVTLNGADVNGQNFAAIGVTHTLLGTVSGDVAGDVTVSLAGARTETTTTNASGQYSFSGLSNGSYTVTPTLAGYTFSPVSSSVTVNGVDVTAAGFTATAVPAATYRISGTVSGAVRAGVTISLSGAATGSATTDAGGAYSFSGLSNGGYTVTPTLAGYTFSPVSNSVTVNGVDVTAAGFTATAVPGPTYTCTASSPNDALRHHASTSAPVVEGQNVSNFGGWITYQVYYGNGKYGIGYISYDSLIELDLSSIPGGESITRATLHLYVVDAWQQYNNDVSLALLSHLRSSGYTGNAYNDYYYGIQGPTPEVDTIYRFTSGVYTGWWTIDVTPQIALDMARGVRWATFWLSPAPWETETHNIVHELKRVSVASADRQGGDFAPFLEIEIAPR
jgi:hypothetical protein